MEEYRKWGLSVSRKSDVFQKKIVLKWQSEQEYGLLILRFKRQTSSQDLFYWNEVGQWLVKILQR